MTKGEDFIKKGRCKNEHSLVMSNSAWCVLKSKRNLVELHDKCPNPKCTCQKMITFTPDLYLLEGGSNKNKCKSIFKGIKKAWDSFIKPSLKMATPLTSAAEAAKTKSPQSAQFTSKILKSITGGKNLSLTNMHGHGLRLRNS